MKKTGFFFESEGLDLNYVDDSSRIRTAEETLSALKIKLPACGVSRIPDITNLDRLSIPTCCAVRPTASVLQVSNGKGLTKVAAQVSAAMESIELLHVENSQHKKLIYQAKSDFAPHQHVLEHQKLVSFREDVYCSDNMKMHWLEVKNVITEQAIWLPASAIIFNQQPAVHRPTTNGLASGNHTIEASIHALYELLERDAGSKLSVNGKLDFNKRSKIIDLETVDNEILQKLIYQMNSRGKVLLCYIESAINVYTFFVVLLNDSAMSSLTTLNIGWGTHRDKNIAASRALTEAAQSRLTAIHGAREDIIVQAGFHNNNVKQSSAYRYFDKLKPHYSWNALPNFSQLQSDNMLIDWQYLLDELKTAGFEQVLQCDLSRDGIDIPVVKMIVPGLNFNQKLF